ncbi:transcriptional coactivator p15/PC4 family protein, partial [Candidatus Latescibacterota bacterium]
MNSTNQFPSVEIKKNDFNVIRISLDSYKDIPFISIRQYFKDIDGEFKPTKKGVT